MSTWTFTDTRQMSGDQLREGLAKWLTRLGGSPNTGDSETDLLIKIVEIVDSTSAFVTLTDGATVLQTMDTSKTSQNATVTLGGNRTLAFDKLTNGMRGVLIVKQDATGSRTLTLPATSKVVDGGAGAVTLTTTASAIDVLSWIYDGTNILWAPGLNFT